MQNIYLQQSWDIWNNPDTLVSSESVVYELCMWGRGHNVCMVAVCNTVSMKSMCVGGKISFSGCAELLEKPACGLPTLLSAHSLAKRLGQAPTRLQMVTGSFLLSIVLWLVYNAKL